MISFTDYKITTKSIPFSILSTMPLLLGYYVLLFVGRSPVKNAAETWVFNIVGSNSDIYALALGIIYFSAILFVLFRKEYNLEAFRSYFPYMVLESVGWAIGSWLIISLGMNAILMMIEPMGEMSYLSMLGMSLGAGLFEELLFRVLIQGGILLLLEKLLTFDKWLSAILAVTIAAALFSVAHFFGEFGDPVEFTTFLYRFFYGVFFGVLIYFRGFAVTSWTHALYDVIVVTI